MKLREEKLLNRFLERMDKGLVRMISRDDLDIVAEMEIEISKISFKDNAIIDRDFHVKKLSKAMEKNNGLGMLIYECNNRILGWLWMDIKKNFLTNEIYANFKSFFVDKSISGTKIVEEFMGYGVSYAKKMEAKYIVGKVHVSNLAMRALYKNGGFQPTHLTMELKL